MDRALIAAAEISEDVASALNQLLRPIPEHSSEITANIGQLFAISSTLRKLEEVLGTRFYSRRFSSIARELDTLLQSLNLTLEDVLRLLAPLGRTSNPGVIAYRQAWADIRNHCREEDGERLHARLEKYNYFSEQLLYLLKDDQPSFEALYHLRAQIRGLLDRQEMLDGAFSRLSIGMQPARGGRTSYGPRSPISPRSPRSPSSSSERDYAFPPVAPEIPISPVTTTSFSTYSSHSSAGNGATFHWASVVFDGRHPTTVFQTPGQPSRCLGKDMPMAQHKVSKDHAKVFELPFENRELFVSLHWRQSDDRARIICTTISSRSGSRKRESCLPLTSLLVRRVESCLQFRRLSGSTGKLELWASLKFTTYERMVLFFCTFLSLKAQDNSESRVGPDDYTLDGEKEEFGGQIYEDGYLHALRIFKDRDSRGIRLEASVLEGELERSPVWTAFITPYVGSSSWIRRRDSCRIYLRELHPYIFAPDYTPLRGPRGEHVLYFTTPDGEYKELLCT
ncbi:hypothetical protein L228DRAFT_127436 [Xylona heveae TC161]|uniref:Uncharacterized protein n=1 Tax=Xylona heveae (strain CBS 132557 / TC161) TaxID=1328760 RepID=A0A165GRG9_XYLHT|nr:hypothetical protein L228DRAFT_127436 [Xylona heveae TC161]KZF22502.1 hypothetical protein L228DRAFT_127436 [Xylona heveae TC161]